MIDRELIIDREKVIAALKECANETGHCSKCPYRTVEYCEYAAMADAAVLLAEQESVKPTKEQNLLFGNFLGWNCGACGFLFLSDYYKYCPHCGRRIDWND